MAEVRETVIIDAKVEGEKDVKNLGKSINENKKQTEKLKNSTGELSGSLDRMTGGAVSGFKGMLASVKGVTTGFRTLKGAIIATGIGALVVIVGSLIAAFKGSEEGQNKWNKIMSITGAIVGNLIDLLADFGDVIIKAVENPKQAWEDLTDALGKGWKFIQTVVINPFVAGFQNLGLKFQANVKKMRIAWNEFTGDSEEAEKLKTELEEVNIKIKENEEIIKKGAKAVVEFYNDAKEAVSEFIDEQVKEGNAAAKVADMRARADKIERKLLVDRAKSENEIAQLRLKARKENEFTAEQRKQFLLEAQALQDDLLKQETEALKLRADAQSLENTFARSNKENLDEEARLKAAVLQQDTKRANFQRQLQRELNTIDNQVSAEQQKRIERDKKRLEEFDKFREDLRKKEEERLAETELEKLELEKQRKIEELENLKISETQKQEALLEIQEIFNARRNDIQAKQAEKEAKQAEELAKKKELIAQKELKAKENREKELQSLTQEGLGALANATGLGKEFAIAKTLFDTFQSARAAFASQLIPGDPTSLPRAIGAAALSAASGLADVASIKAVKTPNVTGGQGGGQSATPPTPPAFNIVGNSNTSAITQPITEGESNPVQAFVVSKNVTTAQQADRNAEKQSTF